MSPKNLQHRIIRPVFLFALICCLAGVCRAQSSIRGKIFNSKNEPAPDASVLLLKSKDSSLMKAMVSDVNGIYVFDNVPTGNYLVQGSALGYKQTYSNLVTINKTNEEATVELTMSEAEAASLTGVTVSTRKPLLEQKIDRLVINVASSITSAGNTALEVLERAPGVLVSRQNNTIAVNGKDGVVIMINGKINHMPASAVIQMLNGMSANNIEKIELITTPPANFDAEGNAGYINIVLKQNSSFGTNGSLSGTLGYGQGWVTEAGMTINHRKGNINWYGDISYSRTKKPFTVTSYNEISNNGKITRTDFEADRTDTTRNINGRFGFDWQASKKTIVGILLSGFDNKYTQSENNVSNISTNAVLDTVIHHANSEINHWYNYGANINFQHNFNEDDKLVINADYIYYGNNQPVNYHSSYYDNEGKFAHEELFRSGKKTPIDFWVFAADYSKKINKNLSFEAGAKQTVSAFHNNISFERFVQNMWVRDDSLSAEYDLNEDYSAAYASLNVGINETTQLKAGLRYEHTNSNLGTQDVKNIVDRHYGDFFPSFFISHKFSEKSSIAFSYSRRITRPTFDDLAPFTYYANANTLLTGNPSLQPALSNNFKADYTIKQCLFSLSYSKEDDAIAQFQPHTDSVTNKVTWSAENMINQKTASLMVAVPVTITKWWNAQLSVTGVWQETNALYKGEPLTAQQTNVSANANMRFTLPRNFSAEVTGQYQSPQLFGVYRVSPTGTLDIGIKKKLPAKWGSLIFNASNILNTSAFTFSTDLPEQNLVGSTSLHFSVPTYKLTYTRNFGNAKLKEKRERMTGAEDEKQRVQH